MPVLGEMALESTISSLIGVFENHFKTQKLQSQISDLITEYTTNYKEKEFEHLSNTEVFDWDGLQNSLTDLPMLYACFLQPRRDERSAIKQTVFSRACSNARADTVAKQQQVQKIMTNVLNIVGNVLLNKSENPLPFNRVIDEIAELTNAFGADIQQELSTFQEKISCQVEQLRKDILKKDSFAQAVDNMQLPPPLSVQFHYRNENIRFHGREKEIAYLNRFLDSDAPLLLTAITGCAGTGKSKLLYEYAKQLEENPCWKFVLYRTPEQISALFAFGEWSYDRNLVVVIDYAGDSIEKIGEWLIALTITDKHPNKLRIVLLEREGIVRDSTSDISSAQSRQIPLWYSRLLGSHRSNDIKALLYAEINGSVFLELQPISRDALCQIMDDYAHNNHKKLTQQQHGEILAYC